MKPKKMVKNARSPKGFWGRMMIEAMNRGHAELSEWGLSFLPQGDYADGLDIGCGGGENVNRLAKICSGKAYGLDVSPLCVEKSVKNCKRLIKTDRVKIAEGSAEKIPFESGSLSLVSAVETVYFWDDIAACFSEIFRALKVGGTFIIINEMTAGTGAEYGNITETVKMNVYSVEDLKTLLSAAGFTISGVETRGNWACYVATKEE